LRLKSVGFLLDLTWVSYFVGGVVIYYAALFALSQFRGGGPDKGGQARPMMVLMVPAHNEEMVIADSLAVLGELDYDRWLVMVVNDNSTDDTGPILERAAAASGGRVLLVDRTGVETGGGKSGALNFGFGVLLDMVEAGDSRLGGHGPETIVVGIVDADGRLDPDALTKVAPFFSDPKVGTVQIGVRIANADSGLLARMQDMEFVGFSFLVQVARDRFGSSGLGGNGQFSRLTALVGLGRAPWEPTALTEDLDLGLSLVEAGWRTRFCSSTFVAQQALTTWAPLMRQRTRWIQGHYQCWRHIPALVKARGIRVATRIDLILYLVLVTTVMFVGYSLVVGLAGAFAWAATTNGFLSFLPDGPYRVATLLFALAPVTAFSITYQRFAKRPLRSWEVPAFALAFSLYSYVWVFATLWAWARIVLRRGSWVKTPRVSVAVGD